MKQIKKTLLSLALVCTLFSFFGNSAFAEIVNRINIRLHCQQGIKEP